MSNDNKRNLVFFESESMRNLYEVMNEWQSNHGKRLLSTNIQQDDGKFCCIALTNPTEVVITNQDGTAYVHVNGAAKALLVQKY